MNFLAHAFLSGNNENILLGNFIGDFIKGRQALAALEPAIAKGVELHRAIDDFTDNHDVVHKSKDRLRPKYRHYSGVIVDVFLDHFLAAGWKKFHPLPLEVFASKTYASIQRFKNILPASFKEMLPYMIRGNWLVSYRDIAAIHRTLSGIASRTPYPSKMEEATVDLRTHYDAFQREFNAFFPDLMDFSERWLNQPGNG